MFRLITVFWAFVLIAILILVGRFLRQWIGVLRSLYLPSSIVAGVVALLLGPSVLGSLVKAMGDSTAPLAIGLFPQSIRDVWSQSPSLFINVVFATLFLGEAVPQPKEIWRKASAQVAFGQILAWGQYVVGLLLTLVILTPLFNVNPLAGTLIEVAFEGGHGTAAGMAGTFVELGFKEGPDLALALATVGLVSGIIAGTWLMQWGLRTGQIKVDRTTHLSADPLEHASGEDEATRTARIRLMGDLMIDPLSLNIGFVGLAIAIGWLILQALVWVESVTWGTSGIRFIPYIPLFPMALIGGIIVQLILIRTRRTYLISRPLMERAGGVALDVTIVTAIATLSLSAIGQNLPTFIVLSIAGIVWNVSVFLFLAPRILPTYWFERGVGDMGQSMGVTSTGLLLIRMVDPYNRSGALESFAYKQLLFEPIVGGGLFTAAAPVLIASFGSIPILLLTSGILLFWIVFGLYNFKRITTQRQQETQD